jgi:hypothetical protein
VVVAVACHLRLERILDHTWLGCTSNLAAFVLSWEEVTVLVPQDCEADILSVERMKQRTDHKEQLTKEERKHID